MTAHPFLSIDRHFFIHHSLALISWLKTNQLPVSQTLHIVDSLPASGLLWWTWTRPDYSQLITPRWTFYRIVRIYTVSGNRCHYIFYIFASNFAKYWPIFEIISPTYVAENLWKSCNTIFHQTLNASLHYLMKYWCQKQQEPETCRVINDTFQRNVATWFRCRGTFYWNCYKFTAVSALKEFLKSVVI